MQIALINTVDAQGGAARAAYRLHSGLRAIGHDSKMIVRFKSIDSPHILNVENLDNTSDINDSELAGFKAIQTRYIEANRTLLSNTLFSFPYPGYDISRLPVVQNAHVINLHWVAAFQSPHTIHQLCSLSKPVVWTLHDMWALTGGCHYSAGCDRYKSDCYGCPQLEHNPYELSAAVLGDKQKLLENSNLTFVTPSQWLADCIKQSAAFKHHRVEVIPNSLETDLFCPTDHHLAKQKLGITPDVFTILIGAGNCNERRKGFPEFLKTIKYCLENRRFREKAEIGKIKIICFGLPSQELSNLEISIVSLGEIRSDATLSEIYSAADIFVLPSLEDNLPNTMLESMACGTPVVGFRIGGLPDLVKDNVTGWLASSEDIEGMGQLILDCCHSPGSLNLIRQNCRQLIESSYTLPIQAQRYSELFSELLESSYESEVYFNSNHTDQILKAPFESKPIISPTLDAHLVFERTALDAVMSEMRELEEKCISNSNSNNESTSLVSETLSSSLTNSDELSAKLKQKKNQIRQLREKLRLAEFKAENLQQEIEAMQSSKFWKMRSFWFKIKAKLKMSR